MHICTRTRARPLLSPHTHTLSLARLHSSLSARYLHSSLPGTESATLALIWSAGRQERGWPSCRAGCNALVWSTGGALMQGLGGNIPLSHHQGALQVQGHSLPGTQVAGQPHTTKYKRLRPRGALPGGQLQQPPAGAGSNLPACPAAAEWAAGACAQGAGPGATAATGNGMHAWGSVRRPVPPPPPFQCTRPPRLGSQPGAALPGAPTTANNVSTAKCWARRGATLGRLARVSLWSSRPADRPRQCRHTPQTPPPTHTESNACAARPGRRGLVGGCTPPPKAPAAAGQVMLLMMPACQMKHCMSCQSAAEAWR